ncbi:MAG: hypothetical protein KC503_18150, partial [Myxococcales bacterium]|nr:hypothetical protein [Myxococcales bacterium]
RAALRSLERGRWALALPDGARDERAALGDRINIARITELPGVYASVALGWPPLSTASGQEARQVLGAPRRVVIDTGSDFAVRDDFAGSVQRALRAAAVWLVGAGLLDPAPRARARLQPLAWPHGLVDGGSVPQQRDGAAGLAAALAYVWGLPGSKPRSAHVGAIARVGPRGRVDGVERFVERLAGLRREAPFVERIYVASSDACAAPPELLEGVELVAVASVAVALDDLFGGLGADIDTSSASHTPKALAARAWQLELELEHDLAAAVAARALDASLSGAQWPQDHRVRAQVTGRSIEAVSLIHRGRAHEALHALDAVEAQLDHVDAALREDILTGAFRAHLVVRRASALIDVLRAGEAAALCEGAADLAAMLPRRQKIELLGTWSRALRAAGQLDRAREIVERQCAIALPSDEPDYLDERPRMLCNRLEVLVALHHSAPGDELAADIEQTLLAARTANSALPDLTSKAQNVRFLDLVEARWSAETADAARAAGLVGAPATTRGLWPEHHVQRFVGEAIARDERLAVEERVDGALARLDEAVGAIPAELQNAAPLLYVVFLSAAARAATIRIRAGRDGWREPASGFMRALSAWAPGAAASAPDGDDASAWVAALEHALDLLPY